MKLIRHFIPIICLVDSFIANAAETPPAKANSPANPPVATELQRLQGTWEGVAVGQEAQGKITIKVTGDSFYFHRDTNFWFDTTIALPAGKEPKQLHATIKDCPPSQGSSAGTVVGAIFKIEDGTLILVTSGGGAEETPKGFETAGDRGLTRYELRKVQSQKKDTPKTK